jgi:hypothetical protein
MVERESPPGGRAWPNSGDIYDTYRRLRVGLLERAEREEAAGHTDEAADRRGRAAQQRRERDRCYREHERRMLNRRIRHGRS